MKDLFFCKNLYTSVSPPIVSVLVLTELSKKKEKKKTSLPCFSDFNLCDVNKGTIPLSG